MQLVIVESPSKASTISKYLGKEYVVTSSIGHIRDLPKSNKNAIDIDDGFIPHYQVIPGKTKVIHDIVSKAKKADVIVLATDMDREGEAIAWHIAEVLREELGEVIMKKIVRATFNSITKDAVTEALKHPRTIDQDLRQAQEARRVLDRIVGYELSGLIWKKVRYGLSAGRVQSPALRIIMEREREIRAFSSEAYYNICGIFSRLSAVGGQAKVNESKFTLVCDVEPTDKKEAERIVKLAKEGTWGVVGIEETQQKRNPKPPFITSTLQQVASTRLGFSASRTMRTAQKLYEAGHITYMRTDSPLLAFEGQKKIIALVSSMFGVSYVHPVQYKSGSKNAQEAHEAIRPTVIDANTHRGNTNDEKRLYDLIWRRTIASQMAPADVIRTKVSANITSSQTSSTSSIPNFSTNGSRVIFDGWLKADPISRGEDIEVPHLKEKESLKLHNLELEEKFTTPPNRYSEAGLIKELEKRGIGRPSTYASIIQTLVERKYVAQDGRTLIPTDTGDVVSSFIESNFPVYISDTFTAEMENHLDEIADGKAKYLSILKNFYSPFHKEIEMKEGIEKITNLGPADSNLLCPICGKDMVIKLGKNGKFISCSNYPDCSGALTVDGKELGKNNGIVIGNDPDTNLPIYAIEGKLGAYVQLGDNPDKNDKEAPKPRRASLARGMKPETLTLEQATKLLSLPRELGTHPTLNEPIIANIGRFGPYVGVNREFRSLKKNDDPYTITFERALELLSKPKALPKGTELIRSLGKHPKTGKEIQLLKSKSGTFLRKGLRRIYIPDNMNVGTMTIDDALMLMQSESK